MTASCGFGKLGAHGKPSRNLEKMMNKRTLAEVFEGWVQSMRSELKNRTIDEVREAFEPVELYQRLDGTRGFTVRFKQTGEVFSVDFEAEWLH